MADLDPDECSIAPCFLVASPKLDDSPFERAVILLVHHDEQGAMGYIVNKPVQVDFGTLIASVNESIEDRILAERFEQTVFFGGPVRMEQLWVLFRRSSPGPPARPLAFEGGAEAHPANLHFGERWTLSAAGRIIERFALEPTDRFFMPMLGYAGWGAGQLADELEDGSWLLADFDEALVCETPRCGLLGPCIEDHRRQSDRFFDDGKSRLGLKPEILPPKTRSPEKNPITKTTDQIRGDLPLEITVDLGQRYATLG